MTIRCPDSSQRPSFQITATLAFISLCCAASANAQRRVKADWKLLKGAAEVCSAYVKMLNQAELNSYPYCDRTPAEKPPGFLYVERIPLSPSQSGRLADQALAFLSSDDQGRVGPGVEAPSAVDSNAEWLADKQRAALESADPLRYLSRFRPGIDIDNDGRVDDVIVWKDPYIYCGGHQFADGTPMYSSTYLFLLSSDGDLDASRTRAIFGHPKRQVLIFPDPREPGKKTIRRERGFRAIGTSFGVFRFKDVTYFDTFYAPGGDLNGDRDGEPGYNETLAVLTNHEGSSQLVCEVRGSNIREAGRTD
jgi:hypothetical protein